MPMVEYVSSLGDRFCRDVSNVLGAIAIRVAEVLFPQGSDADSGELFWVIIFSPAFCKHALPDLLGTDQDFVAWKMNPLVKIIKEYVEKLRKRDKQMRIELLSIMSGAGYP